MHNPQGPMGPPPRSVWDTLEQGFDPAGYMIRRNFVSLAIAISGYFGAWPQCFLHHSMGRRYWTVGRVLGALALMFAWMYAHALFHYMTHPLEYMWGVPFYGMDKRLIWAFAIVSCLHLVHIIIRRTQSEDPWHTMSPGVSILAPLMFRIPLPKVPLFGQLNMTEGFLYRVVEPAVSYLVIWLFIPPSPMHTFLAVCTIGMALQAHLEHKQYLERHLDTHDRMIEAEFYAPGRAQRNIRIHESAGFPVMHMPNTLRLRETHTDNQITTVVQPQKVTPVVMPANKQAKG